jgi:hypothetical protein
VYYPHSDSWERFSILDPALLMEVIPKENNMVSLNSEGSWHFVGTLTGCIALVALVEGRSFFYTQKSILS